MGANMTDDIDDSIDPAVFDAPPERTYEPYVFATKADRVIRTILIWSGAFDLGERAWPLAEPMDDYVAEPVAGRALSVGDVLPE